MVKIIIGVKGTGKTKQLIEAVHNALNATQGDVVCIERGTTLRYSISHKARLVDADEYVIDSADALYGFVAGILAGNHDVTDLFIDHTYNICQRDNAAFEALLVRLDKLSNKLGINIVLTSSIPVEEATDVMKSYLL
ncbi:MAG: hypothetical protein MR471_01095 [Clostridia bacterium]|nr:hypothetical protein [Clostridia bacterium]MDY3785681.1 hypothetical protein [Eubacteriales bacterium]